MLNWILGVHKKANNNFCYCDTGRTPWATDIIPQCIPYFVRVSQTTTGSVNTLLHHAFMEHKQLKLTWYNAWSSIVCESSAGKPAMSTAPAAKEYLREKSVDHWKTELHNQPKMVFYSAIKMEFGEEPYLQLASKQHRTNIVKLRSSTHDLRNETGRYDNYI